MLLKRNLLETLTIISCSGTLICVLLNYVTAISPITGIWFTIYLLLLFVVSVSLSFKFLQWLIHLNKPIKYDIDGLVKQYPYLSFLRNYLPQTQKRTKEECKEYDTNELSVITTVLERKLVSSWYVPYISQEIGFPFACKQMLDQMIGKTFQICNKIDPKDVYVDLCSIFITHLKEYRKALKRHEKNPDAPIETLFKKSHPVHNPDNKLQSADHCTNVVRLILKELVPWELWDTPHSELLVRVLSKKLDTFIQETLSDPAWLNEKLLTLLKGEVANESVPEDVTNAQEEFKEEENEELKEEVPPVEEAMEKPTVESALSTLVTKTTAPILQRAIDEDVEDQGSEAVAGEALEVVEESSVAATEPVDIKSSPVLRQRRGRQGRNEVKIYDRIIEGSVKTWETDLDLQCISLGQDLLASLGGEITLSRLWGQDAEPEGSPHPPRGKSPQPLWFGEEDTVDISEAPGAISPRKSSPKAADALLKDLQSTVHQAKSRIGDLQVPSVPVHVPRVCKSDEAAGMMEGLLDFGIAGLKKGLRFTGLSDDSQEKSPSHRPGERISPPEPGKLPRETRVEPKREIEIKEAVISSVIQREENSNGTAPVLIKQHRVISQDSVPTQPKPLSRSPPLAASGAESPEPEYEEAADLSTSIAKLRCLLQQRAETSPRAEEGWWERAEEARGAPVDAAALADEYNMNIDRNASPNQSSNNMQRLDKLFQRTVTGVFNSLKTAVGAEDAAAGREAPHEWAYVCTSVEQSVCGAVARLVGSRRAWRVDAARDSLQDLRPPPHAPDLVPEDLEEWCALRGTRWSGGAELAAAAGLCQGHLSHRIATIIFADLAEDLIASSLSSAAAWLRREVFAAARAPPAPARTPREFNIDETCAAILEKIPGVVTLCGWESSVAAVRLAAGSAAHAQLAADAWLRALDALALRFRRAAAQGHAFDAG